MSNDLPPWRPIADGLARHNDDAGSGTESQASIRERYEVEAKAIAYEVAVDGTERFKPEKIQSDISTHTPPWTAPSPGNTDE